MEENELLNNNELKMPKKVKDNKKNITFFGFIIRVFCTFISIIVCGCLTIGFTLYFKFNVNIFSVIRQVTILNKQIDEKSFVSNSFSETDYSSFQSKLDNFYLSENVTLFSDKEIASIIDYSLKNSDIAENTDNLEENKNINLFSNKYATLLQIDFYNTNDSKQSSHLTDVNVVFSFDLKKLKEYISQDFVKDILNRISPEKLYVSIDFEITRSSEEEVSSYCVFYKAIRLNNLTNEDSESFISAINSFIKTGTAEQLSLKIGNAISNAIIGNDESNGIYTSLTEYGAKCYSFYSDKNDDYFIIYKNDPDLQAFITYNNIKNATNPNISEYTVLDNDIKLKDLKENGYKFLGWYDSEKDTAQKIEQICAWNLDDYNLFAKWEIIEYNIEYVMRGGVLGEGKQNPTTYTIESVFTLNNPYKTAETPFLGWEGTNLSSPTINVTIKNSYGNLKFYARFEDDERALLMYIGDEKIGESVIIINEMVNQMETNNKATSYLSEKFPGYTVDKWYIDSNLTTEYNFSSVVTDDLSLYASLNYMVNKLKFYPYIEKFEKAVKDKNITIDTREEFQAYFEYVSYYLVTDQVTIKFNYFQDSSQLENEIYLAKNSINFNFQPYYQFQYGIRGVTNKWKAVMSVSPSHWTNGTELKTFDENKKYINKQEEYALELKVPNTRTDDFDDFKINKITKTLKVKHSWQLAYCLEQGYKPVCEQNSSAEKIYNKAKSVLRKICDDSMSDIEKIRTMYEWLVLNVSYDQRALSVAEQNGALSSTLYQYDSWQAEGVFNTGVAVCEGYAKAFLIMSRIEGIPMIYITGDSHAWNRVYLDGNWYGIDATQGDLQYVFSNTNRGYEVLDNFNFLFTDNFKTSCGYTSNDYTEFKAETVYNYYKNAKFTINNQSCDLHCDTKTEMYALIRNIKKYATNNGIQGYSFEFELSDGLTIQDAVNAVCAIYIISSVMSSSNKTTSGYTCVLFYVQ